MAFPYLDFADRGSSHFSASMGCKHNENRSHLLFVTEESMITSCEAVIKKQALVSFDVPLVMNHFSHLHACPRTL